MRKIARINIGQIDMGDHDADWFKVMSKLRGDSIRGNVSSVLGYYVRRRKKQYEGMLAYAAAKYGLTREEVFRRLLNDESLGEPVEGFSIPPPSLDDEEQ